MVVLMFVFVLLMSMLVSVLRGDAVAVHIYMRRNRYDHAMGMARVQMSAVTTGKQRQHEAAGQ